MSEQKSYPKGFAKKDLFFDCPQCGKSLGIDRKGAGLIVTCPDCGQRMQVPVPAMDEEAGTGATSTVDYTQVANPTLNPDDLTQEVERLGVDMEELQKRKAWLERRQQDAMDRFEKIRDEIALLQASLDRMVSVLQDVALPKL